MKNLYDEEIQELLARAGTFDLTGTDAKTGVKFFGFDAEAGTVINTIKGIPLKSTANTTAEITAAEVDVSALLVTSLAAGLLEKFYRVPGYIITNIKLDSGSLHMYLCDEQPAS